MLKDAYDFYRECDRCQRTGNLSRRHEMLLKNILEIELFDGNLYILVAVDYISKWVEAVALVTNDAKLMMNFLHKISSQDSLHLAHLSVMKVLILIVNLLLMPCIGMR
ncbi:Pol polyprotein [Gossypium australe]|uniref:Pol polyprotein n=1 Tax=Gossypium australe TaxID=47621 RepID=A0A5B6W9U6_9ROSI|nr:Pol polyprotein [Gossypium australe]